MLHKRDSSLHLSYLNRQHPISSCSLSFIILLRHSYLSSSFSLLVTTMSKTLGDFFQKAQAIKNASAEFTATAAEGGRIIPFPRHYAAFQLRVDAGHYDPNTKKLNVVLQINAQARSPALRDWARKNSTHDKLATASFDTSVEDKEAEFASVLKKLENEAKQRLGS